MRRAQFFAARSFQVVSFPGGIARGHAAPLDCAALRLSACAAGERCPELSSNARLRHARRARPALRENQRRNITPAPQAPAWHEGPLLRARCAHLPRSALARSASSAGDCLNSFAQLASRHLPRGRPSSMATSVHAVSLHCVCCLSVLQSTAFQLGPVAISAPRPLGRAPLGEGLVRTRALELA